MVFRRTLIASDVTSDGGGPDCRRRYEASVGLVIGGAAATGDESRACLPSSMFPAALVLM